MRRNDDDEFYRDKAESTKDAPPTSRRDRTKKHIKDQTQLPTAAPLPKPMNESRNNQLAIYRNQKRNKRNNAMDDDDEEEGEEDANDFYSLTERSNRPAARQKKTCFSIMRKK